MIDTHAHLTDEVFDTDRDEVIVRANNVGIHAIVAVSETLTEAQRCLKIAETHPAIFPAAGLYPAHLDLEQAEATITFIRENRDRLVAIGEVGLDYWVVKEENEKAIQRQIFCQFIELSKELSLPLNIHSRSAGRHTIALLLEKEAQKVHLHAYDGKASSALPGVEAGYYFSIPPSIVRSKQKQKLVKRLPIASLLVESDSPVLGPDRETRNEPANIALVIDAISELKGIDREEVVENIDHNTKKLYGEKLFQ
jgi:TatD DNase family protein